MKRLGEFLLSHRAYAVLIALLCAFLPLLSSFALAILALVTLRKGWQEGLWILLATLVPTMVVYTFAEPDPLLLLITAATNVMVWVLAIELRRTVSWSWVIQVGAIAGIVFIVALHLLSTDLHAWWTQRLEFYLGQVKTLFTGWSDAQLAHFIHRAAQLASGMQTAMVLMMALTWLMLGRWWQAALFNPGQLQPELHQVQATRSLSLVLVVVVLTALMTRSPMMMDLIPVAILPFMLSGLSVVHYFVAAKKLSVLWLGLFYIVSMLTLVYSTGFLVALGLMDSGLNLRKKL